MKKVVSLLLCLVLAFGIAGCANNPANNPDVTEPPEPTAAEATKEPSSEASSEEIVELTLAFWDMQSAEPYATWVKQFNKALLENNINAQIKFIDAGTDAAMLVSNGELADILYFQDGWINDYEFATQGLLLDLTDYIENSTYIKAIEEAFPYQKERMKNWPYVLYFATPDIRTGLIRQDALNACDIAEEFMQNPTIENYEILFEQLMAQGYEMAWVNGTGDFIELNPTFDMAFGLTQTWMKQDDGSYVYCRVTEESLNQLKWYADMYKKGYLDPDLATNTWEEKENILFTGRAAINAARFGWASQYYSDSVVNQFGEGAEFIAIPPAKGVSQGYLTSVARETRGFAISALTERADLCFSIFEFLASPEGRVIDLFGVEGDHYTRSEDGTINLAEHVNNWEPTFSTALVNLDQSKINPETPYWTTAGNSALETYMKYAALDNDFTVPADLAVNWDAATTLWNQFAMQFVLGQKTEADWEDFVENWYAYGGKEMTEYAASVLN